VGFDQDHKKRSPQGQKPRSAGSDKAPSKAAGRLSASSVGGFDDARGALGFSEQRAAALELSKDGDALRPWMPVPGVLRDLIDEPVALGVGHNFDLLESERERRRRLRANRFMDTLQAEAPSLRSVGEAFGVASEDMEGETAKGPALSSLQRAWRPQAATPLRAFSSSLELAMATHDEDDERKTASIDLAPGEAADLAQFTLEKGPDWVYEEISKLRTWAGRHRDVSNGEEP
jgi:hypothetical protein